MNKIEITIKDTANILHPRQEDTISGAYLSIAEIPLAGRDALCTVHVIG